MFDDWKEQTNQYICRHINRKLFAAIANELDGDIPELSELYTSVLLDHGVIDNTGDETGVDMDEDDLLDAMLNSFLIEHPSDDERAALYAVLIDSYLTLVEEMSEDI